MNKSGMMVAALVAGMAMAGAATAQRDPAYASARAEGQVGEQPDGYLGVVGSGDGTLRALVGNINIQRKAKYTQGAQGGATVEQFAFASGCNLILQTRPGEKYRTPGGEWKTRGAGAPERDGRCV